MKVKILIMSIVVSILVGCNSFSNSQKRVLNLKYFDTSLSKEKWELGYGGENKQQGMNEYVLLGESVQKWTELVTEQYKFQFDKKLLPKLVSLLKSQLQKGSKNFKWAVIEKKDDTIVFEWSHKGSGIYPPTYEIVKLVARNGGIYRIAYDKYTEKIDDDIKKWKKYIINATIK